MATHPPSPLPRCRYVNFSEQRDQLYRRKEVRCSLAGCRA